MPDDDLWTDDLGYIDLATDERKQLKSDTKDLLWNLHEKHPEIFDSEPLEPSDYKRMRKDALFSIGGRLRQTHGADNEDKVEQVFLEPAQEQGLLTYDDQRSEERVDFKGRLASNDAFAMDVKGGEGQSIGHLLVPGNTDTLTVWSQRNSTNTKSPSSRLNEVINRLVRWGFNQEQSPALMVIHDPPAGSRTDEGDVIPDVVIWPRHFPHPDEPEPPMNNAEDIEFVKILFQVTIGRDLDDEEVQRHIWYHDLWLEPKEGNPTEYYVGKKIWNSYHGDNVQLPTQRIDYSRISDVAERELEE